MSYYTTDDFYYQVSNFGSYDVKILIERINHYDLELHDVIEHTFDSWNKEEIFNDDYVGINHFFDSLLVLRIYQLIEYTKESINQIEESEEKLLQNANKLLKYLEEASFDKIHLNACCSCFDCDILDNKLFSVKNSDDIIKALEEMGDFEI